MENLMQTVTVDLNERSYDIRIGRHLIDICGKEIHPLINRPKVAVISDEGAAEHYLERLQKSLVSCGIEYNSLILPSGESTKSWHYLQHSVEWLINSKIERNDTIITLGGGVIGDITGFAAAILRRGVKFIQVPTTLLAQVDSSVGGKTGINSPSGKNLIGAFHQPKLVLCDVELLKTLPRREFLAGCGEVVKYGLIKDKKLFAWLEDITDSLNASSPEILIQTVYNCCRIKADLVSDDESEEGKRSLLNLGHTFAHALETAVGYKGDLLHGEAVAIGCCLAIELSFKLGFCPENDVLRTIALFQKLGMKTKLTEISGLTSSPDDLIRYIQQDKKVNSGQVRFVLVSEIGNAFISNDVDLSFVRQFLADKLLA